MSFIQMATNTHRMLFINDQADKKHGNNLIQSKLKLIVIEQHEVSNSLLTPFFLFVQLGLETGPQNTGTACTSKVGFYPCFYLPSVSRKGLFSKLRRMTELRYIPENLCIVQTFHPLPVHITILFTFLIQSIKFFFFKIVLSTCSGWTNLFLGKFD